MWKTEVLDPLELDAGLTNSCELPDVGMGTELGCYGRAPNAHTIEPYL